MFLIARAVPTPLLFSQHTHTHTHTHGTEAQLYYNDDPPLLAPCILIFVWQARKYTDAMHVQ